VLKTVQHKYYSESVFW